MASDVRGALVDLMSAPSRLNSRDAAVKKLAEMQLKGRYLQVRRCFGPLCSRSCATCQTLVDCCSRTCGADAEAWCGGRVNALLLATVGTVYSRMKK